MMVVARWVVSLNLLALIGCASVFDPDASLASAPFRIESGGRIVVDTIVNDAGPFGFALDTGASISVAFDELRASLGIDVIEGRDVIIHGAAASRTFPLVNVARIAVGDERWDDALLVGMSRHPETGSSIDGILGIDFLRRYAVGFSSRERIVRLYPPEMLAERSYRGWVTIPLTARRVGSGGASLYYLDVALAGRDVQAMFDLGSGVNLMNWRAARLLGAEPGSAATASRRTVVGAIDAAPDAALLRDVGVRTRSVDWGKATFAVSDLAIYDTLSLGDIPAAILGARLFTQRDFIIDFRRHRLLVSTSER